METDVDPTDDDPLREAMRLVLGLPPDQEPGDAELVARLLHAHMEACDAWPELRAWRAWARAKLEAGGVEDARPMGDEALRVALSRIGGVP